MRQYWQFMRKNYQFNLYNLVYFRNYSSIFLYVIIILNFGTINIGK